MVQASGSISLLLSLMMTFLSSKTVIGTYQPAYLKTNMFGKNPSTNTLRVIQEQTESLSFEWKPMKHDSFKYAYLENSAAYFWKKERYILAGDIGNLETIGRPCEAITYKAEGYYNGFMGYRTLFLTYNIEYERVPRIKNVLIQMQSDSSSRITLEREESPCEVDTTVMFRGRSKNKLEMFIMPRNQVEYYMNHTEVKERSTEVFILFNRRGDRFSLPTIDELTNKKVNKERSTTQTEYELPDKKLNKEGSTTQTESVNVTLMNEENTANLNTSSDVLHSSFFEVIGTPNIIIPILVVIIFVVSIGLFFLIKLF
ncbi:unnamed protein product [Schistosoma bovis]|nr:unnamed protein product [Schistosoma bovis]CAH8620748.1 unnamed protein product [Schistosoma bovis]